MEVVFSLKVGQIFLDEGLPRRAHSAGADKLYRRIADLKASRGYSFIQHGPDQLSSQAVDGKDHA